MWKNSLDPSSNRLLLLLLLVNNVERNSYVVGEDKNRKQQRKWREKGNQYLLLREHIDTRNRWMDGRMDGRMDGWMNGLPRIYEI